MSGSPFSLIVAVLLVTNVQTAHLRELAGQYPPERKLATCTFESGVDYIGNDLSSVSGRPAFACCDVCFTTPGCGAWSWSNYSGGTCWLKSTKGATTSVPDVSSGEMTGAQDCALQYGTYFVDNDIANTVNYPDPSQCCDVCRNHRGCHAFSWTTHMGGTCWLKSRTALIVPDTDITSCQVLPNPTPPCSGPLQYDTENIGNDIKSVREYDPGFCCFLCVEDPECHAFSWTTHMGGTCWLKSTIGPTIPKPGVISGII